MQIITGGTGSWDVIDRLLGNIHVPEDGPCPPAFSHDPGPIDVTETLGKQLQDQRIGMP